MRSLPRSSLLPRLGALGLAGILAACSGGDDEVDAGPADAGPADTGVEVDAGPPDSGVQGACDPVTGDGCLNPAQSCVLQISDDEGECRELINPAAHEAECNQSLQNCEAGFACLFLEDDDTPTCRKVCDVRSGDGCAGVQGSAAAYACNIRLQGIREYGFCGEAAEACDPLNNTCGMGQNCGFVDDDGNTGCIPAGSTPLGGTCQMDACRVPGMCVTLTNISMNPTCYEPCDLTDPVCTQPNYECGDIGAPFGLCVPMQ